MADNTTINAGSGGDVIATDEIGGVKFPRSKIVLGADGQNDGDVSGSNPLPIAGSISATGNVGHGSADSGNPLKIGGKAATTVPSAVGAGSRVDAYFDANGRLVIRLDTALPAGTNNIGDVDVASLPGTVQADIGAIKTAVETIDNAVSGAEIQVDVVTLPALPAGGNNIGTVNVGSQPARTAAADSITALLATNALQNGLTSLTPKFAIIATTASGDYQIVAAVASKKLRALAVILCADATGTVKFQSDDAGGTPADITGALPLTSHKPIALPFSPVGWFETQAGKKLNLNVGAAMTVGGAVVYVEV